MFSFIHIYSLQEKQVLPSAYSFAVSFLSGLTAKGLMPSAMGKADGIELADGVGLICRQPLLSRQLADGKQRNSWRQRRADDTTQATWPSQPRDNGAQDLPSAG